MATHVHENNIVVQYIFHFQRPTSFFITDLNGFSVQPKWEISLYSCIITYLHTKEKSKTTYTDGSTYILNLSQKLQKSIIFQSSLTNSEGRVVLFRSNLVMATPSECTHSHCTQQINEGWIANTSHSAIDCVADKLYGGLSQNFY